jgi:hypothetical protein
MEAKVERLEVKSASGNNAFEWGENVPEFKLVETDDNDEVKDVEVEEWAARISSRLMKRIVNEGYEPTCGSLILAL